MTVSVRYFAALRERRGNDLEQVTTEASTVSELYRDLADRYPLKMDASLVRFAVNGEFVHANTLLSDGSEVALIPPVAGG